jgi:hypothetical protein
MTKELENKIALVADCYRFYLCGKNQEATLI